MSEQRFDIVFGGELVPGCSAEVVSENLAKLFKASPETITRLMAGGKHALKKGADHATALKYQAAMERAGARAELLPCAGTAAGGTAAAPASTAAATPAPAVTLSIAAAGADLLAAHERRILSPAHVDVEHLKLASLFAAPPQDDRPSPPSPPDTSHISVAQVGADLLPDRDNSPPPTPPDTSGISLAAAGENLGPLSAPTTFAVPDTSAMSLAPPGAPLDQLRSTLPPLNPDISALRLEP